MTERWEHDPRSPWLSQGHAALRAEREENALLRRSREPVLEQAEILRLRAELDEEREENERLWLGMHDCVGRALKRTVTTEADRRLLERCRNYLARPRGVPTIAVGVTLLRDLDARLGREKAKEEKLCPTCRSYYITEDAPCPRCMWTHKA